MTPQSPRTVDLFVSGHWQPTQAGQYESATSPVTGELIGHVAQGDRADAGAAIQAAAGALGGWAAATAFARALHRVGDACQRRRDELAKALTLDQGKPLHAEASGPLKPACRWPGGRRARRSCLRWATTAHGLVLAAHGARQRPEGRSHRPRGDLRPSRARQPGRLAGGRDHADR